jgi:acyl-CoA thioesterase I
MRNACVNQINQINPARGRTARRRCIQWVYRLLLGVLFLSGACSPEAPSGRAQRAGEERSETGRPSGTIVAVGDSLTAGLGVDEDQAYPARLERKLKANGHDWRVVNAGVSGETSSGTLSRIEWVISSLDPDIVILETGANDGLRGIEPRLLHDNLDKLVAVLKKNRIEVVLAGMRMLPNLGPEYVAAFGRIYPQVARGHEVILVPFFLQGVAGDRRLNQPDGIHPTAEGYARIVEHIYPYVLQAIQRRTGNRAVREGQIRGMTADHRRF